MREQYEQPLYDKDAIMNSLKATFPNGKKDEDDHNYPGNGQLLHHPTNLKSWR
jgi:hypothetical protein